MYNSLCFKIIFLAIVFALNACNTLKQIPANNTTFNTTQPQLINNKQANQAIKNLEIFKQMQKFEEDQNKFYPGMDLQIIAKANELINASADDFINVCKSGKISDIAFKNEIKAGLNSFSNLKLNRMDKERICDYYKELMQMVGLQSSGGYLNQFRNSVNP